MTVWCIYVYAFALYYVIHTTYMRQYIIHLPHCEDIYLLYEPLLSYMLLPTAYTHSYTFFLIHPLPRTINRPSPSPLFAGRSCIIALNKWDLVPEKDDKTYLKAIDNIRIALPILKWAEVRCIVHYMCTI